MAIALHRHQSRKTSLWLWIAGGLSCAFSALSAVLVLAASVTVGSPTAPARGREHPCSEGNMQHPKAS